MTIKTAADVLDFWFSPDMEPHWFSKSDAMRSLVIAPPRSPLLRSPNRCEVLDGRVGAGVHGRGSEGTTVRDSAALGGRRSRGTRLRQSSSASQWMATITFKVSKG